MSGFSSPISEEIPMALIRRVTRLFAADMHAVLDQIEEPEALLRQAIREMEEELARQRQREKWLTAEIEAVTARIGGFDDLRRDLDAKLDICFANENDALARKVTRRKLETAKLAEQTEANRETLKRQLDEQTALVEQNADQLESMHQKAAVFAAEAPHDRNRPRAFGGIDDDEVEIAYLREKQARATS